MTSVQDPRIITGAGTKLFANVSNTAPLGSDNLNYHVDYSMVPPEEELDANGVLAPGQSQLWVDNFAEGPGTYERSVTISDPNASNSPVVGVFDVTVLEHSHPFLWLAGIIYDLLVGPVEPIITPEQFAATGGGEDYAALAPNVFGNTHFPTARLDLDSVSSTGDPEIRTNLVPFSNLPSNEDPAFGVPFLIEVLLEKPGIFTKTFFLNFSDEDLPGASSPESVTTQFTIVMTVVPEPTTALLLASGLAALAVGRRRKTL